MNLKIKRLEENIERKDKIIALKCKRVEVLEKEIRMNDNLDYVKQKAVSEYMRRQINYFGRCFEGCMTDKEVNLPYFEQYLSSE